MGMKIEINHLRDGMTIDRHFFAEKDGLARKDRLANQQGQQILNLINSLAEPRQRLRRFRNDIREEPYALVSVDESSRPMDQSKTVTTSTQFGSRDLESQTSLFLAECVWRLSSRFQFRSSLPAAAETVDGKPIPQG